MDLTIQSPYQRKQDLRVAQRLQSWVLAAAAESVRGCNRDSARLFEPLVQVTVENTPWSAGPPGLENHKDVR